MTTSLPPASLWEQYSVIAILVLVFVVLAVAGKAAFKEFRTWQTEQDGKREKERETQRGWEAEQNKLREVEQHKRDEMWRTFFNQLQERQSEDTRKTNEILGKLVERMDAVTIELREHDIWAHEAINQVRPMRQRK
ncbi:MAG: hypothetical protein IT308_07615 [Anaerolineaceae bacterium]|nr:hypothetical protein [Anaerolineaceae bacterium]